MMPVAAHSQPLPAQPIAQTGRSFSSAKVTRFVLHLLSNLFFIGGVTLVGAVAISAVSGWHFITAVAYFFLADRYGRKGNAILDVNDPQEMARERQWALNQHYASLAQRFPVSTLLQLLSRDILRQKFLLALQATPSCTFCRVNAEYFFQEQLIPLQLLTAIQQRDEGLIRRLAAQ